MLNGVDALKRQRLIHELAEHRALHAHLIFKLDQTYLRAAHYEESLDFTEAAILRLEKDIARIGRPDLIQKLVDWIRL